MTIDGVTFNNLSDNFADISAVPVQNIERIEIIKGPASSSWGSSLGGIINVITKSEADSRKIGGILSASYGERNTGDYRVEASGKVERFGYYLFAGNLVSDGLRPNTSFYENNLYSRIKWDITRAANLYLTFGYNRGTRGAGEVVESDLSFGNAFEYLFATLSSNYAFSDESELNISLRTSRRNVEQSLRLLSTGEEFATSSSDEKNNGISAKFTWAHESHSLVVGSDYDDGELRSDNITGGKQELRKWAVFANDTIEMNKFSLTPGIRYDHTSTNGDFLSPSLGATYRIGGKTLLRGYVARGFSIPPLSATFGTGFFSLPNQDLKVEKVWSVQAGLESADLRYLWFRTNLFLHDIKDAIANEVLPDGTFMAVNRDRQRRKGFEVEVKTVPVYNTSFSAGFTFVDAEDRDTGDTIRDVPRYTYDITVHYDDNKSFNALLKGHYIWWNAFPEDNGKYTAFIWDLHFRKRFSIGDRRDLELFLSAHNVFNGSQYLIGAFKNPRRWIEGGVRLKLL